jgi:hypothetical protein
MVQRAVGDARSSFPDAQLFADDAVRSLAWPNGGANVATD